MYFIKYFTVEENNLLTKLSKEEFIERFKIKYLKVCGSDFLSTLDQDNSAKQVLDFLNISNKEINEINDELGNKYFYGKYFEVLKELVQEYEYIKDIDNNCFDNIMQQGYHEYENDGEATSYNSFEFYKIDGENDYLGGETNESEEYLTFATKNIIQYLQKLHNVNIYFNFS